MPPSCSVPFAPLNGVFFDPFTAMGPPLSLRKNTSVFSSMPFSRKAASTAPTPSSMTLNIAACVRRVPSSMDLNRSRYDSGTCIGACTAL